MTQEEAFKEIEKYVITSISTEDNKHININVAKRVIEELIKRNEHLEDVNKNYGDTIVALRSRVKELEEHKTCESCINNDICPMFDAFVDIMNYPFNKGLKTFSCNKHKPKDGL